MDQTETNTPSSDDTQQEAQAPKNDDVREPSGLRGLLARLNAYYYSIPFWRLYFTVFAVFAVCFYFALFAESDDPKSVPPTFADVRNHTAAIADSMKALGPQLVDSGKKAYDKAIAPFVKASEDNEQHPEQRHDAR